LRPELRLFKVRLLTISSLLILIIAFVLGIILFFNQETGQEPPLIPLKKSIIARQYDLVVVSGEPEGIAAAVSAARNGLHTLLVDNRTTLGGLMTLGWLNGIDMNYNPRGQILNKGFFLDFYRAMGGDSFDINSAINFFNEAVNREKNLAVLTGAGDVTPLLKKEGGENQITAVNIKLPSGKTMTINALRFIDATQDADLAAAAKVPFTFGQSDYGHPHRLMCSTLIFKLKGVNNADWLLLRLAAKYRHDPDDPSGSSAVTVWGFNQIMQNYHSSDPSRLAMTGLNLGRQKDGSILVNALELYGVNPLDEQSRKGARQLALQELSRIIKYLRENIPGLGHARFAGVAPELYTRESRHMEGLYRLTINDVLDNRDFPDRIAFGSYPVDIQPSGPGDSGNIIGKPEEYAIPFRCLVPHGVDNLLVVGRSASFDSLAAGSARVIPVGMATGQAAGAAAALSIEKRISFPLMSKSPGLIKELQNRLTRQGMDLHPFHLYSVTTQNRYLAGLSFMRRWGLASGGYENDYRLNEEITVGQFASELKDLAEIMGYKLPATAITTLSRERPNKLLTFPLAAATICAMKDYNLPPEIAVRFLEHRGFWPNWLQPKNPDIPLNRGEAYMLAERFTTFYLQATKINQSGENKPRKPLVIDLASTKRTGEQHIQVSSLHSITRNTLTRRG